MSTRQAVKAPAQPWLSAAARATYVAFIGCGFAFASWALRIPQVRDRLHLTSADVGLVLLTTAAGSITALLLAGVIVSRFHSRRTVTAMVALHVPVTAHLLAVAVVEAAVIPAAVRSFIPAADDPSAAAGRVSVVASIGYCAFLGGPPLIGYLGQNVTVLRALVAVAVVLGLATLVTGSLRPLPVDSRPRSHRSDVGE